MSNDLILILAVILGIVTLVLAISGVTSKSARIILDSKERPQKNLVVLLQEELLGLSLRDALYFMMGLVFSSSSGALLAVLVSNLWEGVEQNYTLLILTGVLGGAFVFTTVYQKYKKNRPSFPALEFDFRILEKEIIHEYKDADVLVHTRKLKLKTLKKNIRSYRGKYHWTGSILPILSTPIEGHKILETSRHNVWRPYIVEFPRFLDKGEIIQVEITFNAEKAGDAVPFFSSTIVEPTDKLVMRLKLPPEFGVKQAIYEVASRDGAREPFKTGVILLDEKGTAVWEVIKPSLLFHYEMRWNMPSNFGISMENEDK